MRFFSALQAFVCTLVDTLVLGSITTLLFLAALPCVGATLMILVATAPIVSAEAVPTLAEAQIAVYEGGEGAFKTRMRYENSAALPEGSSTTWTGRAARVKSGSIRSYAVEFILYADGSAVSALAKVNKDGEVAVKLHTLRWEPVDDSFRIIDPRTTATPAFVLETLELHGETRFRATVAHEGSVLAVERTYVKVPEPVAGLPE